MLTEKELTELADYFADIYSKASEDIMAEIGKNLKRTGDLTPSQAKSIQQMHKSGADMRKLDAILKRTSGKGLSDMQALYEYAVSDSYDWAEPFYRAKGLTSIPLKDNPALKTMLNAIARSSGKEITNLSKTSVVGIQSAKGFTPLDKFYKDTINKAILSAATGAEGYSKAVERAIKELGGSGLKVQYAKGSTRRLDSAVKQNVMDGMSKLAQETAKYHGEQFGADGYEISAHSPCAPDHLPHQGLQYTKDEFEDLQSGLDRQIGEWNCRHIAYPIIVGVSGAANSREELAEMERYSNEKIEIDGHEYTRYECSQIQRRLETEMRKANEQRILGKNSGVKDLERQARERLNQLTNKYAEVSRKSDLPVKAERMRAVEKSLAEKVAKSRESDIIKSDEFIPRSVGASGKNYPVRLPDGGHAKFAEGTSITKIKVFAGKGTDTPIRDAPLLESVYHRPAAGWQKVRGEGIIVEKGKNRTVEVHWYEFDGNKVEMKVKRYFDES